MKGARRSGSQSTLLAWSTRMIPRSGRPAPASILKSVDLPAPLGPTTAMIARHHLEGDVGEVAPSPAAFATQSCFTSIRPSGGGNCVTAISASRAASRLLSLSYAVLAWMVLRHVDRICSMGWRACPARNEAANTAPAEMLLLIANHAEAECRRLKRKPQEFADSDVSAGGEARGSRAPSWFLAPAGGEPSPDACQERVHFRHRPGPVPGWHSRAAASLARCSGSLVVC